MKLSILYFASLRESLGTERESIDVPAGVATIAELREWLCARGGVWASALAEGRNVRAAMDQTISRHDARLHDDAEIAFFPPVTGG